MAQVKVLLEGYTNADRKEAGEEEETRCTMSLIRDHDMVAIVDPGVLADQKTLVEALALENLKVEDVTHVFITHSHMDHYRNISMFARAKDVDYWGIWDGAKCEERPTKLTDDIKIVETPGHSYDGLTYIVNTLEGKIAIVGDLWWSERGPKHDKFASDMPKLLESRQMMLGVADYIVPGHGKMWKIER